MYWNRITGEVSEKPSVPNSWNLTPEQLASKGWLLVTEIETPMEGFRVTAIDYAELTKTTCKQIVKAQINIANEKAAQDLAAQAGKEAFEATISNPDNWSKEARLILALIKPLINDKATPEEWKAFLTDQYKQLK